MIIWFNVYKGPSQHYLSYYPNPNRATKTSITTLFGKVSDFPSFSDSRKIILKKTNNTLKPFQSRRSMWTNEKMLMYCNLLPLATKSCYLGLKRKKFETTEYQGGNRFQATSCLRVTTLTIQQSVHINMTPSSKMYINNSLWTGYFQKLWW